MLCGVTFSILHLNLWWFVTAAPETLIIYNLTSFLSSVPAAGSPAVSDSTQRCRRRCLSPAWHQTLEGRRAGGCLHCEFHTGNGCSRPKQAALCESGGSPTAAWSSLPCRSNDLDSETPVPLMSCTVVVHMLDWDKHEYYSNRTNLVYSSPSTNLWSQQI